MNTLGALSELLIRDEFLNKKSLSFEKRTELTKPLFCSAVRLSAGRRLEQLCAALDTNGFKSPQKLPL
jgi:hypothetical protein